MKNLFLINQSSLSELKCAVILVKIILTILYNSRKYFITYIVGEYNSFKEIICEKIFMEKMPFLQVVRGHWTTNYNGAQNFIITLFEYICSKTLITFIEFLVIGSIVVSIITNQIIGNVYQFIFHCLIPSLSQLYSNHSMHKKNKNRLRP